MTDGNDPINPIDYSVVTDFGDSVNMQLPGLTKREYFAAMAMQGFCASDEYSTRYDPDVALASVQMADALIVELNKEA